MTAHTSEGGDTASAQKSMWYLLPLSYHYRALLGLEISSFGRYWYIHLDEYIYELIKKEKKHTHTHIHMCVCVLGSKKRTTFVIEFSTSDDNSSITKNKKKWYRNPRCIHSRFPITRFPETKPLFNERVSPPYNEQTIDPSSPTTAEWSTLEFEKVINEFDGFYHKLMN